jgi:hypothetical protein
MDQAGTLGHLHELAASSSVATNHLALREWLMTLPLADLARYLEDDRAEEPLRQSYVHGNHFIKLVLAEAAGLRLVAHIWDPPESLEPSYLRNAYDVHDHRWQFASRVLAGSLRVEHHRRAETSRPNDDVQLYKTYIYSSPGNSSFAALRSTGLRKLITEFIGDLAADQVFSLDCSVLHRTYPASIDRTVTLVIQGPAIARNARQYRSVSEPLRSQLPIDRLDGPARDCALSALIDILLS